MQWTEPEAVVNNDFHYKGSWVNIVMPAVAKLLCLIDQILYIGLGSNLPMVPGFFFWEGA